MSDSNSNWDNYLTVASLTDMGMRRTNNQDNLCISLASNPDQWGRRGHLFIVADGMGAHAAGELASKLAVDQIPHLLGKYREMPSGESLRRAIVDANTEIHRRGQANEEFHHMGTTCSALTLSPEGALLAHVGDSRIYRLRGTRLEQLTFDHSLVWEMRAAGNLAGKEDLVKIPKNVITRSLGPYPEVNVDLEGPFPVQSGDTFLICSDGLSGQVADGEIGAFLAVLQPSEAARVLVDLANLRGGPDNSTVIIVRVNSTQPGHLTRRSGGGGTAKPVRLHPAFWLFFAVLLSLSGLAFLFKSPIWVALTLAGLAATTLLTGLIKLALAGGGPASSSGAQHPRYGKAPYTQTDCSNTGWELIHKLKDIIEQIKSEARTREWKLDLNKLAELVSHGDQAALNKDLRTGIRSFSLAICSLMEQLRSQSGASGTSIDL